MNTCACRIDKLNSEAWTLTLSSPEGARSLAETALAAAEEAGYEPGMAEARLNLGWCEYYLTRLGPAMESFQEALSGFTGLGDALGLMKSLNALGVTYMDMGRYERAMDFYTRSLEEARRQGNRLREAVTLDSIGEVCLEFGEIKEAFDYFLRAYETVPDDGEGEGEIIASILLDVGKAYQNMGNWSLARDFAEKAMAVAQKDGNLQVEGQCWHLLGLISLANDRLELAASHYVKALGFSETLKNERERASVLLDLGYIHVMAGDLGRALDRFKVALAIAEGIGAKRLINSAYERLSEAYEAMGDFRKALDYYKRFSRFKHESLSEDAGRKIKNIAVQYEVEKSSREAEIYRLKNIELKEKTEELESANRQILAIAETGRLITASLDLDTIINTLYETLSRYIPFDLFGLALYEEDEKALDYRAYILHGEHIQRSRISPDTERSYEAICLHDKAPVFVPNTATTPAAPPEAESIRYGPSSARPAGSLMFLPLVIDDRVMGLLTVQSDGQDAITSRHLTLVEALAPYVAVAVENSLIRDRLEAYNHAIRGEKEELEKAAVSITYLANHDPLTGLPNRRLLFELLQKTFDIARRNGTRVGVLYIDLDDFKPINDRLGHSAGDRALVAVAERLRSMLRASDTVARVGGDEFVAVLTTVKDGSDIALAAKKILEECGRPLVIEGDRCRVGFSMGIALFPDDGDSIELIVNAADAAMYRVKHGSKGGYAFAGGKFETETPVSPRR
ncbi:MAG: diguanylate cyclase [Rectinemataceae bacterium]|jgi:diguanylate cyclase (GGDEF)-like protein